MNQDEKVEVFDRIDIKLGGLGYLLGYYFASLTEEEIFDWKKTLENLREELIFEGEL